MSMKSCLITGSSGFVGTNFCNNLKQDFKIVKYDKIKPKYIQEDIVIHLAGIAHDLKNSTNPKEYYQVNTELTKKLFNEFLASKASVFIYLSSVKAVADRVIGELTEEHLPNPVTHYGKSKLLAEQFIFSKPIHQGKRVYVLRPCMIHGPGNKGNLNILFKLVSKQIPWPLGAFENKRSFCSIDNLIFVIGELIKRDDIPSGIYNVADNETIGTNALVSMIAKSQNRKPQIWSISKKLIIMSAKFGDLIKLPLNTERLDKLTQNYVVSNQKILKAIGKDLPFKAADGMFNTLNSFNS